MHAKWKKEKKRKKKDSDRKLTSFLTLDTPKEMFDRRTVSQSQTAIETR